MVIPAAPSVVLLGGPNGAGKSTAAPRLLKGRLAVNEYVNADIIARGLAGFLPDAAALEAGGIMLRRIHELAAQRVDFGFESTLASRTLAPWLRQIIRDGYRFHLLFFWLPSADLAVARVAQRVARGGHTVPESTIRRRYTLGLRNLATLFRPIATTWRVYDNSQRAGPRPVATGKGAAMVRVLDRETWDAIERGAELGE